MESTKENCNKPNNMLEKKIIVDLIILTIILIFISLFFVYDIVDRGTINKSQTTTVVYPEKDNNPDNNPDDDNTYTYSNGTTTNIVETRLQIFQGTKQWSELKELDIFNKSAIHVVENKIAPGVDGTYTYTVENNGDVSMLYNMDYIEENPYNIDMVYKLKINGSYVAGNDETWVDIDQLKQTGLKIRKNTTDVFVVYWKWQDAENDTEIGKTEGANYKLNIKADAEAITNE